MAFSVILWDNAIILFFFFCTECSYFVWLLLLYVSLKYWSLFLSSFIQFQSFKCHLLAETAAWICLALTCLPHQTCVNCFLNFPHGCLRSTSCKKVKRKQNQTLIKWQNKTTDNTIYWWRWRATELPYFHSWCNFLQPLSETPRLLKIDLNIPKTPKVHLVNAQ